MNSTLYANVVMAMVVVLGSVSMAARNYRNIDRCTCEAYGNFYTVDSSDNCKSFYQSTGRYALGTRQPTAAGTQFDVSICSQRHIGEFQCPRGCPSGPRPTTTPAAPKNCGLPPHIPYTRVAPGYGREDGDVVAYSCIPGYKQQRGSFFKTCRDGSWVTHGPALVCVVDDVDECAEGTDNCDFHAECENTAGSFTCTCIAGYTGNGVYCEDINECQKGTDNCDPNADCANTDGSYECTCRPGYTGNGVFCRDIDECEEGTNNCHYNADCTNTVGSYTCACKAGYYGDGRLSCKA